MEDSVGLGNHIRHDAITGAAESSESDDLFKSFHDHATVFVSAATTKDQYAPRMQPQHTSPSFPLTLAHSSSTTCHMGPSLHPHVQHQPLPPQFARQPPVPLNALFPSPPPHPSLQANIPQPISQIPTPQHMSLHFHPPPGMPPQFPPPQGVPPNFGPLPMSSSTNTAGNIPTLPNGPTRLAPKYDTQNMSGSQNSTSPPLPQQSNALYPSSHVQQQSSIPAHHQAAPMSNDVIQRKAPSKDEDVNIHTKIDQSNDAVEKARAIARRFHAEMTSNSSLILDNSIPSGINYLEKRREHFQKEQTRLDKFRLKNLEYVIKHDEDELRRHVDCMNQITAFEEKQSIKLELAKQQQLEGQLKLEQRKQQKTQTSMINATNGGIGSQDQQRAERVRKREHLEQGTSCVVKSNEASSSMPMQRNSLYLTNLPTDGSTTERMLHSLFSLYGRLDRVTMYRHRSTGERKGDGLIVFGRDALEAYSKAGGDGDLVGAVCLQMNGAELPCGTAMGVQPADTSYNKKSPKEHRSNIQAKPTLDGDAKSVKNGKDEAKIQQEIITSEDATEELDDFFASL